jgi:hypothetical protein
LVPTTACSMLMVPILLPAPVAIVVEVAGAVGEPVAGEPAALGGAAALVWANAEIMETTAMARIERSNLLVIVSLNSLEHVSGNYGSGKNSDYPFQATLDRTHEIFCFLQRPPPDIVPKTRRNGLPASHAGVADMSSTHYQTSAMAWMKAIIESLLSPRQTFYCELAAANLSFETCP